MPSTAMSKRLQYLHQQQAQALLEAFLADHRNVYYANWTIGEDGKNLETHEFRDVIFATYREADPTPTGACLQWLIRQAIAGDMPAEDLPQARETLEAFLAYKRRLPAEQRDLGRHKHLGSVWKAVEPFVQENAPVSGKDEDRRERDAVRAESTIVLEQDGWIVAIPRTERAAKWWGRGTRWCTAADDSNMFDHYAGDGPLVVFVHPDGAKFQWHGPSNQFMDAADEPCSQGKTLTKILDV